MDELAFKRERVRIAWQQGRLDEVWKILHRATREDPENPHHWGDLAAFHTSVEQLATAIPCWEKALALSPVDALFPRLELARVLRELNRTRETEPYLQAAIAIEPNDADLRIEVGEFYHELGAFDEAEAHFRAACQIDPQNPRALARLGSLLGARIGDADLQAVEDALADPKTSPVRRARLLFARARIADARGDYARAGASLREGNALHLANLGDAGRFDPKAYDRFIDRILAGFPSELLERNAGVGHETRRLVFIVGLPRSGTSLLEQILASHPRVHGVGELMIARRVLEMVPHALGVRATDLEAAPGLHPEAIRRLAQAYLSRLKPRDNPKADRVIDKMPENYFYLGLLTMLFPNAVFLHTTRDVRDVALSSWMADFTSIAWAHDHHALAQVFQQYQRLMTHWRSCPTLTIHDVAYEELVADLEGVARRVIGVLGLEWDPACLDFHRADRPVRTASLSQVRQPISTRSVGRWKHYAEHIPELFAGLPI